MPHSEQYTHGHHESVLRSHMARTVENSVAYLESALKPGLSLLDVGCGPGTITVDFGARLAPGRVVGIDASETVVEQARTLAEAAGATNVEFVVGDAYALDFPDDSFDIVHTHQTLQHVADPVAVLRDMRRVAVPGGIVAAREVDYAGTIWYPELPGLDEWMRIYQQVHRGSGGEPNAGRRLKSWALEAGFAELASSASIWCFETDADRQWWGKAWAARAVESDFAAHALERSVATRPELEAIGQAWRQWAASEDGWYAMPHGEVIARV